MFSIPVMPDWESLHPLIIHFPIALLLVAPLFLVLGAVLRGERGRPYLVTALLLMVLGTAGAWLAVATGEAAAEMLERNDQVSAVLEQHQKLAETTRTVFTILAAAFALVLFVPRWLSRESGRAATILPFAFLLFYAAGVLLLVNTAHKGGTLVHGLGATSATISTGAAE